MPLLASCAFAADNLQVTVEVDDITFLNGHDGLLSMSPADRIRACYQHACLMYVSNQRMNNTSLRNRFGVDPANAASMSRYFNEALKAGVIRIGNSESKSTKDRWYLPAWV